MAAKTTPANRNADGHGVAATKGSDMSTTTSALTFTAHSEYPTVTEDAIKDLMDAGATEKQSVAVLLADAGMTDGQIGAAFGYLFGREIKSGGAGNVKVAGLRSLGRMVGPSSTGARLPKAGKLSERIAGQKAAFETAREAEGARIAEADNALNVSDEDIVSEATERITKAIDTLKAEMKALASDPSAYVEAERTKRTAHADQLRDGLTERLAAIDHAEAEWKAEMQALVEALGA